MVSSISRILAEATATLWIVGQKQSSSSSSVSSSSFQKISKLTSSPISKEEEEINQKRRSLQAGRSNSIIMRMRFFVVKTLVCFIVCLVSFITLYYAICSPPLHLFYDVAPSAGPSSVYLPGSGFSGFWFHFGYLNSVENLYDFDYYCYSAGCLSILPVFLNRSLEEVYDTASATQNAWKSGNLSRFEIVDYFFEQLVPPDEELLRFLPRIKILVTTVADGFQVLEATNRQELKDHIIKTTWVPYITGWGFLSDTNTKDDDDDDDDDEDNKKKNDIYALDGVFSQVLHPSCETELQFPFMLESLLYTFNPDLSRDQVRMFWKKGNEYTYPLPTSTSTTAAKLAKAKTAARPQDTIMMYNQSYSIMDFFEEKYIMVETTY